MNSFSVSKLQQFSGIKAHTIRIWEQRYNALQPDRSEGNTRYYNGEQLRRLLNIVSLLNTDKRISELCSMSDEQLNQLVKKHMTPAKGPAPEYEFYVSQIIAAALEYDEISFDKVFSNAMLRYGLRHAYIHIIYPSLQRLSLMWSTCVLAPAQEHFITGLFRQKFLTATDALPVPHSAAAAKDAWVLYLPEDDFHEMGLLLANYLLRQAGKKVIYLGANVPFDSLIDAVNIINPAHLLFFLVNKNEADQNEELLKNTCRQFHFLKVYAACDKAQVNGFRKPKNLTLLHAVEDLDNVLKN
ncbi:MerR family transcriptional regulator [Niastella caeni]|uniref:MerR family transcriptional regulator n=1 Tax=Niastella caeni TaxID=2569763 RepID=UPI00140DB6BF|nr:MerR family transcriptional regulator [Niastella caeni]